MKAVVALRGAPPRGAGAAFTSAGARTAGCPGRAQARTEPAAAAAQREPRLGWGGLRMAERRRRRRRRGAGSAGGGEARRGEARLGTAREEAAAVRAPRGTCPGPDAAAGARGLRGGEAKNHHTRAGRCGCRPPRGGARAPPPHPHPQRGPRHVSLYFGLALPLGYLLAAPREARRGRVAAGQAAGRWGCLE